jgi:hypothetical protein
VVAISGSVVALPLVGCVPLHPPEAVQDCAAVALHFRVAGVPMAMLLLVATRETCGFAVALTAGAMKEFTPDDSPHAARADNAAAAAIERSRREAAAERQVIRTGVSSMSLPVCKGNSHRSVGLRPAELIIASP